MSKQVANEEKEMTFGEHLDELRKILVRVIVVIITLFIVMFAIDNIWLNILLGPSQGDFLTYHFFDWLADVINSDALRISPADNFDLINTKVAGQFMLAMKSAFVGSFIIAVPYLIFELWLFVKPAIPVKMQRKCARYAMITPLWFFGGLLFGYFIIVPLTINFLTNYTIDHVAIQNLITPDSFISTVIGVSMAAGITFLLPMFIRLIANMGLVTAPTLKQYRKHAIAVLIIFAAIITPPDVFSQILIFIPCYIMYEYGIRIAARIDAEREAAEKAQGAKAVAAAVEDDDEVEDRETVKYDD